jgi:acetyl-CoA carboxylase biotin carboxyl carrier protein
MDIPIDKIRELADLACEKELAEITVTDGEQSVTLKMPTAFATSAVQVMPSAPAPALPAQMPAPSVVKPENPPALLSQGPPSNVTVVTAPMVGMFYRSPSPESPPFVELGQMISTGQTLCIIEAMKLMNELESEVSGKVSKLLVENGQPVEFGQPLFWIEAT